MRLIVLALLIATALLPAVDGRDVFVLIGQSNMDGRGAIKDLPAELAKPSADFHIFYRHPQFTANGWQPLAPGFSIAPGFKGKALPGTTFGCELTFAPTLAAAVPSLKIALIKATKGGTSLAKDWMPGAKGDAAGQGPCYQNFTAAMAEALPALPGGPHRLRGVVWHQGESDAGLPAGAYDRLLTTFIARVREDLGAPDLPFVIGEVFDNGKRDHVRAAQQAVAKAVPRCAFVSCDGLATFDKGTHFDAAGQLELGRRYAAAMAKLIAAK